MSWFASVVPAPADPILGLSELFRADPRKEKLNLSVGIYRDAHLRPFIFQAVKQAEELLWKQEKDKEYLSISGDPLFLKRIGELSFGSRLWPEYQERIAALQTVGGTGALRIGGDFLRSLNLGTLFLSTPTWPNHHRVMEKTGLSIEQYPYYDPEKKGVDSQKLFQFCETLPPSSILLLHESCHNPTGYDLHVDEWKELSKIMLRKELFPFFDCAYQGFGTDLNEDMQALRIFVEDGHELCLSYSCSKNFSLYCERVGALFIVAKDRNRSETVLSNLKMLTRGLISNPPAHGARTVSLVLDTPALRSLWEKELQAIRQRVDSMKQEVARRLGAGYSFLLKTKGIFCLTGLSPKQVQQLQEEYGIYMTVDGRINLAGLNEEAIGLLVRAMQRVN